MPTTYKDVQHSAGLSNTLNKAVHGAKCELARFSRLEDMSSQDIATVTRSPEITALLTAEDRETALVDYLQLYVPTMLLMHMNRLVNDVAQRGFFNACQLEAYNYILAAHTKRNQLAHAVTRLEFDSIQLPVSSYDPCLGTAELAKLYSAGAKGAKGREILDGPITPHMIAEAEQLIAQTEIPAKADQTDEELLAPVIAWLAQEKRELRKEQVVQRARTCRSRRLPKCKSKRPLVVEVGSHGKSLVHGSTGSIRLVT